MSLHSSLRVDSASAQQRTVLSRIERIKDLMKKGLWEENMSVTGLPKTKIIKVKAKKKEKAEEETPEGEQAAEVKEEAAAAPADKK